MKYSGTQLEALLIDGYNVAPALSENVTISKESITQQTNGFGASSEEHDPVGLERGMINIGGGFYDEVADALHSANTGVIGVRRVMCILPFSNAIGKPFVGCEGAYTQKYEAQDSRDGLTKAMLGYVVDGALEEGVIVQNLATFTADWDTSTGGVGADDNPVFSGDEGVARSIDITSNSVANPTVITTPTAHGLTSGDAVRISGVTGSTPSINGDYVVTVLTATTFTVPVNVTVAGTGGSFKKLNSNNGGIGFLQITAFSGFSAVDCEILHSADDVTYATLLTFDQMTGIGGQAKEVSGSVDPYLSFAGDVTGTGSVTCFGGFCRR